MQTPELPQELQELLLYYSARSMRSLILVCRAFKEICNKLWSSIITDFDTMRDDEKLFWKKRFLGGKLMKIVDCQVRQTIACNCVCISRTTPDNFCYINTEGEIYLGEYFQSKITLKNQIVKRILQIGNCFCVLFLDRTMIIVSDGNILLKLEGITSILKYKGSLITVSSNTISRISFNPVKFVFQVLVNFEFTNLLFSDTKTFFIMKNNKTFSCNKEVIEFTAEFLESLSDKDFTFFSNLLYLEFREYHLDEDFPQAIDFTHEITENTEGVFYAIF